MTPWLGALQKAWNVGYSVGAGVVKAGIGTIPEAAMTGTALAKGIYNNRHLIKSAAIPLALGLGITSGAFNASETYKAGPMNFAPISGSALYTARSGIRDLGADGSLVLASSKRRNG